MYGPASPIACGLSRALCNGANALIFIVTSIIIRLPSRGLHLLLGDESVFVCPRRLPRSRAARHQQISRMIGEGSRPPPGRDVRPEKCESLRETSHIQVLVGAMTDPDCDA